MLFPIECKTGWGYINKKGQIAIEPEFEWALSFNDGLAAVKKNGKFGYINPQGDTEIDFTFLSVDDFYDGVARVSYMENEVKKTVA